MRWFTIFGPGAVIASLTIGAGELIFSSRGGGIFGYRLLWFLALVLVLKWALVYASARHMILSGAHPFERWQRLPGPRGWLGLVFLLLAAVCFPIWVGFHAGTVGTLLSWLAGTQTSLGPSAHLLWGLAALGLVLGLVATGGYNRLERVQVGIVSTMLVSVVVSLLFLKPDWMELLKGLLLPGPLQYPSWVVELREFSSRPVWVETVTYVGVVGGSGYDYLAYISYLREKGWGYAGRKLATREELDAVAHDPRHPIRAWLRAPLIDCTLSFAAVLVFTVVFVACGALVLSPQQRLPAGSDLLSLQAAFVTRVHPWLELVYFAGALLAMAGTLYGTIEVAPAILKEIARAFLGTPKDQGQDKLRSLSVWWVGAGGFATLLLSLGYALIFSAGTPPGLIGILTPANLFTGVLACGLICFFNLWMDWRFLPRRLRMNWPLAALNLLAALFFLALGLKGYWDHSGGWSLGILAGTLLAGWVAACCWQRTGAASFEE